jgi:hypothetical protein
MLRRALPAALLGAAAFVLAACTEDSRGGPVTGSAGCDTSFRLVNNSSVTVRNLYFSHSSRSGWGVDQLGANVIAPGRSATYRAANAGSYDFRVVWANGRAAELRQVNICRASQIIVTDGGLRAI